jgi:hypothetical protein
MYGFLGYLCKEHERLLPLRNPQYIYRLLDETGVRYIGRSMDVGHRLSQHVSRCDLTADEWEASELKRGLGMKMTCGVS